MEDKRYLTKQQLIERNQALHFTIEKQKKELAEKTALYEQQQEALKNSELYFNVAEVILIVIGHDQIIREINEKGCKLLGYSRRDLVGSNWFDTCLPDDVIQDVKTVWDDIMSGRIEMVEYFKNSIRTMTGERRLLSWHNAVLFDKNGRIDAVICSGEDITDSVKKEVIIAEQVEHILELSTPVLEVLDGVVVAPLIGTIDSRRTQMFMDRMLTCVTETKSPVALIDITGVPTVDTQTAQYLIESVAAATLLGTKVIITGISPTIAQTLVHLGIDLSSIITKSSLSAGMKIALDIMKLKLVPSEVEEEI